jgi:hypothetical protein
MNYLVLKSQQPKNPKIFIITRILNFVTAVVSVVVAVADDINRLILGFSDLKDFIYRFFRAKAKG